MGTDLKKTFKPWHLLAIGGACAAVFYVWIHLNGVPAIFRSAEATPVPQSGSYPPLSSAQMVGSDIMVTIRPKIEGWLTVRISDSKHKDVRTLFDGMIRPGEYTYAWNRKDDKGKKVPSGRYFCQMKYRDIQMQTMFAIQVP